MILGHDFLGLGSKHWNVKETIAALPNGVAVGCFDSTWPNNFGDPLPNIRALCKSGKVVAVRVQAWWSYEHRIVPLGVLKSALPRWEKLAKEFPGIQFFISPSCEYRWKEDGKGVVTAADLSARVALVQSLAPSTIPVLSPWLAPSLPNVITEHHGAKAKAKPGEIVSYDGGGSKACGFDEEIGADKWIAQNKRARILFCWSPIYNCAEADNTLKPNQRTATPNGKYIRAMQRLMEPKGEAPKKQFAGSVSPFNKPNLYKLFAEDMQGANPRDNKPLVITKHAGPSVSLLTSNGREVAKFSLFGSVGSFNGLSRYYSGWSGASNLFGYEIAEKAKQLSGSEWVWIKAGDKVYGPVHPAFRTPYYQ